ncbi:MAG: response regulator transcription factor [Saprospiraceae bacterium]|nr:response regulator transcription factor [Saprospiraceae bacterium]
MAYYSSYRPNVTRVCIVEDDHVIREAFATLIGAIDNYDIVGTYGNAEDAIAAVESVRPDVLLMDIELPGINGIEGISRIKKIRPKTQVIVVTVYENDDLVFRALCEGAGGYLTKNMKPERLIEAIREIMEGGAPMSTNIARMVVSSFQKNHNSPLTARETEVLELLAQGKSYSSIAQELYVDKETIRTHIKNIYWKLEVHSKAEAIEKAKKERFI